MHEAGIEIVLVVTIVNNVNNDQVGPIVKFAMENPKKISFVSFQPVSFTGRDEEITPERRIRQRYTLSHLAQDVSAQVGKVEPTRDWFPISFISTFAGFSDLVHGPDSQLPPELRRGHGADDQQGNQGVGSGTAFPERAAIDPRRGEYYGRGARQEFFKLHDGAGTA